MQAGLGTSEWKRFVHDVKSLLFGLRDDADSLLVYNDWRLRKFLSSKFPELPRQEKPPHEFYHVGEIVECKLQKSEWSRAKIILARPSHTYDIK